MYLCTYYTCRKRKSYNLWDNSCDVKIYQIKYYEYISLSSRNSPVRNYPNMIFSIRDFLTDCTIKLHNYVDRTYCY